MRRVSSTAPTHTSLCVEYPSYLGLATMWIFQTRGTCLHWEEETEWSDVSISSLDYIEVLNCSITKVILSFFLWLRICFFHADQLHYQFVVLRGGLLSQEFSQRISYIFYIFLFFRLVLVLSTHSCTYSFFNYLHRLE